MSAHLKSQHSIDEKSEVLQSKTGTKNSTETGQSKIQDVLENKLPRSGNRATAITKSIGVFIAKDIESLGLYVVYIVYHLARIKNH